MTIAIDPGNKYTGIAISDKGNRIASPLKTIYSKKTKVIIYEISKVVEHFGTNTLVIGVPDFIQNNSLWTKIESVKAHFSNAGISIIEWDESFTTKLSQKSKDDHQKAATIILQEYLDNINR